MSKEKDDENKSEESISLVVDNAKIADSSIVDFIPYDPLSESKAIPIGKNSNSSRHWTMREMLNDLLTQLDEGKIDEGCRAMVLLATPATGVDGTFSSTYYNVGLNNMEAVGLMAIKKTDLINEM